MTLAFFKRKGQYSWLQLSRILVSDKVTVTVNEHHCRNPVTINRRMAFMIAERGCTNAIGALIKSKAYKQWLRGIHPP